MTSASKLPAFPSIPSLSLPSSLTASCPVLEEQEHLQTQDRSDTPRSPTWAGGYKMLSWKLPKYIVPDLTGFEVGSQALPTPSMVTVSLSCLSLLDLRSPLEQLGMDIKHLAQSRMMVRTCSSQLLAERPLAHPAAQALRGPVCHEARSQEPPTAVKDNARPGEGWAGIAFLDGCSSGQGERGIL